MIEPPDVDRIQEEWPATTPLGIFCGLIVSMPLWIGLFLAIRFKAFWWPFGAVIVMERIAWEVVKWVTE